MLQVFKFAVNAKSMKFFVFVSIILNVGFSIAVYSGAEVLSRATNIIETGQVGQMPTVILFAVVTTILLIAFSIAINILRQYMIKNAI